MKKPVLVCPHCGNKTPHSEVFVHHFTADWYSSDGSPTEDPPLSTYHGLACDTCKDLSIYHSHEYDDRGGLGTLHFPENPAIDPSIPEIVSKNYREAKRVQKVSPNAFAVLIRRALEGLCDDRGTKKGNLHKRLKELVDRGEIPPVLVEITTALRTLGNSGAHNTEQSVTVPMTWKMDSFYKTLVEYVYIAPARLKDFKEQSEAKEKQRPNKTGDDNSE